MQEQKGRAPRASDEVRIARSIGLVKLADRTERPRRKRGCVRGACTGDLQRRRSDTAAAITAGACVEACTHLCRWRLLSGDRRFSGSARVHCGVERRVPPLRDV